MAEETRESQLIQTFAMLADTLVAGFDVVDLLQGLVEKCQVLLDTTDAGILLADGEGRLEVLASTDERIELIELMQLEPNDGPCVECFRTGRSVSVPEIEALDDKWPQFRRSAIEQGYHAVHALPLRLREETIGSLNLFREQAGPLAEFDATAAQAMADVATIGILQERTIAESDLIRRQLQRALDSRVLIEQAKGVVSYTRRISIDDAFAMIRGFAREHQRALTSVAEDIVERRLEL
ncbi:MAG TPA: GAF and ANTAR domain-containing protein [Microbacteriaceae bacterium]|jgi:transcriptional regulator with GAF, ATPase, and Fis domain|nr:GAF and ANTAR domain-containing protein [Microbacteriaceae bacterium]